MNYILPLRILYLLALTLTLFILQGTTHLLDHNIGQPLTMFKNKYIYDNIDAQGTAYFNEIRNSMVDAANAYYTAAQYLLWVNVKPPK